MPPTPGLLSWCQTKEIGSKSYIPNILGGINSCDTVGGMLHLQSDMCHVQDDSKQVKGES